MNTADKAYTVVILLYIKKLDTLFSVMGNNSALLCSGR